MAKSRFRRKSYRKKTKTARRQKRKSRRMRGGANYPVDKDSVVAWSNNRDHENCTLEMKANGRSRIFTGRDIKGLHYTELKQMAAKNDNNWSITKPYELEFTSPCPP